MLRPARTVRVTTKEEVEVALATADQITVEGDDELLLMRSIRPQAMARRTRSRLKSI
jgi:hypothetical protein